MRGVLVSETCATCRFWRTGSDDAPNVAGCAPNIGRFAPNIGRCMRFPPVVTDSYKDGLWPTVSRWNWCGEHQPREVGSASDGEEWLSRSVRFSTTEAVGNKRREPGFYWVREAPDVEPQVAEFNFGHWHITDVEGWFAADEYEQISPRLEPPA